MSACPACRADVPVDARFCPSCGTRLEAAGTEATERKVVTTLFADLVGFTALGERHDPEDIDVALRGFYTLARTIVERFGGTVEKFIGDAVVGLFGVPTAHEDDAERAVRAALELVAHLHELPPVGEEQLQVRCAVNTGPALVRLDVPPETGEGILVGDAVNTCARLLAQTPSMGVIAGETTQHLSARAIAYEELPAVTAKGKSAPVRRWLAEGTIARRGDEASQIELAPLVGREVELAVLDALLAKAIDSSRMHHVLITGEAGIGKSRVVRELFRRVDTRASFFCTWRQARCPAYGPDLAFWALREIITSHTGITAADDPETIEQKLASAVDPAPDREWLLSRLRPLVGLLSPLGERRDNFLAWITFFERVAQHLPLVLVIEDLQWASEGTLAFLDELADASLRAPLLLITTARPEYRSEMAAGDPDTFLHMPLRALTTEEASRLAAKLAKAAGHPGLASAVEEGCGGNPLFAEELARYMCEKSGGPGAEQQAQPDPPDTLTALIAARVDALTSRERAVLLNAAVIGRVFWPEALMAEGCGSPMSSPRHSAHWCHVTFWSPNRPLFRGSTSSTRSDTPSHSRSPTDDSPVTTGLASTPRSRSGSRRWKPPAWPTCLPTTTRRPMTWQRPWVTSSSGKRYARRPLERLRPPETRRSQWMSRLPNVTTARPSYCSKTRVQPHSRLLASGPRALGKRPRARGTRRRGDGLGRTPGTGGARSLRGGCDPVGPAGLGA